MTVRLPVRIPRALVCLFAIAAAAVPGTASAGRYYSEAWNSDGQQYYGAFGTWDNDTMYLTDYSNGQHINSEMWFMNRPGLIGDFFLWE